METTAANSGDSKKPFKVKDVTRNIKKAVCASSLEEIRSKVAEKFEKSDHLPTIHLDSDGTEIDDEEYFRTLDENTELVAVFPGEHWIDVKDVTRNIKKAVCASSLEEIRSKVAEKFEKSDHLPTIHLDSDGTEIDDEEYFRTLDENTELVAVFPGEHWIDPTHYVTITTPHGSDVGTGNGDSGTGGEGDTTDASNSESARIRQLVGQLQNNLCNVSVMNDADLDSLSNMDPNSLVDITGKEFMEQLKDAGRPLCAKRNAEDRLNLLKLLKAGAIFCSERYPEDAEAIDREIGRQLNEAESGQMSTTAASNTRTIEVVQCDNQNTTITITVGEANTTTCSTASSNHSGGSAAEVAANEANANLNGNPNANGDI